MAHYKGEDPTKRDAIMKMEYVMDAKVTMKSLAKKYKLCDSAVQAIGKRDEWKVARQEYLAKLQDEAMKDVAKGISTRVTTVNNKHFVTWEKMLVIINQALDDYQNQLVHKNGKFKGDIKLGKLESIAKIMLMIQQGQRIAKGIIDPAEAKKIEIAFKRLELEAKRLAGDPDEPVDDGFESALDATAQRVWGDMNGVEVTQE